MVSDILCNVSTTITVDFPSLRYPRRPRRYMMTTSTALIALRIASLSKFSYNTLNRWSCLYCSEIPHHLFFCVMVLHAIVNVTVNADAFIAPHAVFINPIAMAVLDIITMALQLKIMGTLTKTLLLFIPFLLLLFFCEVVMDFTSRRNRSQYVIMCDVCGAYASALLQGCFRGPESYMYFPVLICYPVGTYVFP